MKNALEDAVNDQIAEHEAPTYEKYRLPYTTESMYTPDFFLSNGILIEVKGYFEAEDRSKLIQIKKQHPCLDIRIILQNPRQYLSSAKSATLGDWCDKNGFPYAVKRIPDEWFAERKTKNDLETIMKELQERKKK